MQEKNKTNFHDILDIDLITQNGNVKYNLTATKRIKRLMARAQSVVILIHGFTESSEGMMVNAIASELLKKPDLKVFALDGRKIINLEYFSSSTNVRFMGEVLGSFLADVVNGECKKASLNLHFATNLFGVDVASVKFSMSIKSLFAVTSIVTSFQAAISFT